MAAEVLLERAQRARVLPEADQSADSREFVLDFDLTQQASQLLLGSGAPGAAGRPRQPSDDEAIAGAPAAQATPGPSFPQLNQHCPPSLQASTALPAA